MYISKAQYFSCRYIHQSMGIKTYSSGAREADLCGLSSWGICRTGWTNMFRQVKRAICKSQHTTIQLPTTTNLKQFCWQIRKFGIVLQTHKFLEIFWHNNIYEPKYQDMFNFGYVYLRMFELPILVLYEKSSKNICVRISQEFC